jgi:hypothetical protein
MWSNGDRADLVWFVGGDDASLAWSTYTQGGDTLTYSHVVGDDGRVLYRNDLVDFADSVGRRASTTTPRLRRAVATRESSTWSPNGWIARRATWLRGVNVSAWADVDDDDAVDERERTPLPGRDGHPEFALEEFDDNSLCTSTYVCTWDPETAYSWRRNKAADVTNAFYLANRFRDWLTRPAIGFDAAGGGFERDGGDPLLLHTLNGAATDSGLPDGEHVNTATMTTPPDGLPPVMQLHLLHEPGQPNSVDPFLPTSTSFEAGTVFHEFTHGMSNRLVVDAGGNSTLHRIQAGAMGEAWSDYFAMDYLELKGHVRDTARDGELRHGDYAFAGSGGWRTQSIDCDPDSAAPACTDIDGAVGGYTYGDLATVGGSPQVPRKRRGLDPDPVGRSRGAGQRPGVAGHHRGDAAEPGGSHHARHARRDPAGRPGHQRRCSQPGAVAGLRRTRHGLVRRRGRRRRRLPHRELPGPAALRRGDGGDLRDPDRRPDR